MIVIPLKRYGVQVDYDHRNGTYLVLSLDPLQDKQLIHHQLQMLLNNRIPHLIDTELERKNDNYLLHYNLSSKKRLFQMLKTSPPSVPMFYEMAYRLVKTISDSTVYMLNEEQYILHEDFIFGGMDVADIYLCYLPLTTAYSVRMEDQLRLILLRMIATINCLNEDNSGILKVLNILQEENFLISNLKSVLQNAWMVDAKTTDKHTNQAQLSKKQLNTNDKQQLWLKIKSIWNKQLEIKSHSIKPTSVEHKPITGVTEMLVNKQEKTQEELRIIISKNGVEEVIHFLDDRFIIGRNQSGVHYVDTTEGISRVHCELVKSDNIFQVRDLGSLNGSYLNGELLVSYKAYPFKFGDLLKIVSTEIRLAN